MENKFREGTDSFNLSPCYYILEDHLGKVETKLTELAEKLALDNWTGDRNNECIQAHEAVQLYSTKIIALCDTMMAASITLHKQVVQFNSGADCLSHIRTWGLW